MRPSLSGLSLILIVGTAACNTREEPALTQDAPGSATGDPAVVHHPEPPARPAEKIDSVQLEGTYERFAAKLVQPAGSPRFSTYMPEQMIFESVSSGDGDAYYFYTNFAGQRNENAFLLVFLFPQGTTEIQAQQLVQAFKTSRGARGTEGERFRFIRNGTSYHGGISLRNHSGRYYYVAEQYPAEYGDGFGPRAAYIRSQWAWLDTGHRL